MQTVPCGHCLGCRAEQGRQWAVRITHEAQMHESSWFVTLTYDDEHIPDNYSLHPPHLRKFFKDMRKGRPPGTFSYYACGEYGELTQRPHYHAVLFGPHLLDRVPHPDPTRHNVWISPTLEAVWPYGHSEIGTVTMASASYVAGYVRKKVRPDGNERLTIDASTGEILQPEFARMSRRPAIGKRWIEKYWPDVYPRDYVVVDGIEAKPPRYYDKFMDEHHPHIMAEVREKRYEEMEDLDKYTLAAKEKKHEARTQLFAQRTTV